MSALNRSHLQSPGSSPFQFEVEIMEDAGTACRSFSITLTDAGTQLKNSRTYQLRERSHQAYLDLFHEIAIDFNLRLAKNKETSLKVPSPAQPAYRVVLNSNLDREMYFGYGDPAIISVTHQAQRWYYIVSTSNDARNAFPLIRSRDLVNWEFCSYIFPEGKKPEWAAEGEFVSDYWAPEIHQVGNEFRIYFVARDKNSKELCIGMARSASPDGAFEAEKKPLLSGNVIDPHLFVQDAEHAFLLWKEDNNDVWPQKLVAFLTHYPELIRRLFPQAADQATAALMVALSPWISRLEAMERFFVLQLFIEAVIERYPVFEKELIRIAQEKPEMKNAIAEILPYMKTPVYMQPLSRDGTQLMAERTKVLENDRPWEGHLVEGVWLTLHDNKFYLFYAANDFSTDQYGVGVAVADQLSGPYLKRDQPLLQSSPDWLAPGHPSVLKIANDEYLMFLHAYFPGEAGYKKFRALLEIPLTLKNGAVAISGSPVS